MDSMVSIGEEAKAAFISKIEADVEVRPAAINTVCIRYFLSLVSTEDEPHGLQSTGWYTRLPSTDQ